MKNILTRIFQEDRFNSKGFSLIELSVIISIAAAATVGFLAWTHPAAITNAQKAIETKDKMDKIQKAIEAFRVERGRVPCPADPYMRVDNTRNAAGGTDYYVNDYGEEDLDTDQTTVNGVTTLGVDCPVSQGAVPVQAIGLGSEFIEDAWDRRFTYRIADTLCGADIGTENISSSLSTAVGCSKRDYEKNSGNIIITDGSTNITTTAAYVIASHGANGNGAFLPSGSKLADGAGNELENSDGDITFVKAPFTSTFDDITLYKTKLQVEKLVDNKNVKQISVADCEENSQALKDIDATETTAMSTHITGYDPDTGNKAAMSVMRTIQAICVNYYGTAPGTINGQTWSGPQCPGNNDPVTNGSTYFAATDLCTCLGNAWNGSCTMDWSAAMPVRSGLALWLDANDTTTVFTDVACTTAAADTNTIACWKDKSETDKNAVQNISARRPTYRTDILGSTDRDIIRFDNSNDMLEVYDLTLNAQMTLFAVGQFAASSLNALFIEHNKDNNPDSFYFYGYGESPFIIRRSSSTIVPANSVGWFTANPAIGTLYYDGTNAHYMLNGADQPVTAGAIGNAASTATLYIGDRFTGGLSTSGDLGELIIFNRSLTDTERGYMHEYLSLKWNIVLP